MNSTRTVETIIQLTSPLSITGAAASATVSTASVVASCAKAGSAASRDAVESISFFISVPP